MGAFRVGVFSIWFKVQLQYSCCMLYYEFLLRAWACVKAGLCQTNQMIEDQGWLQWTCLELFTPGHSV